MFIFGWNYLSSNNTIIDDCFILFCKLLLRQTVKQIYFVVIFVKVERRNIDCECWLRERGSFTFKNAP